MATKWRKPTKREKDKLARKSYSPSEMESIQNAFDPDQHSWQRWREFMRV
jgi:hypothetical protein